MNRAVAVRHDWTLRELTALHDLPLLELVARAAEVHRTRHDAGAVQVCKLISVKTGGCPEDCKYCSQSRRYQTGVDAQPLMPVAEVVETARRAKQSGATRVCLGAAWRGPKDNADFAQVLDMVREVDALGVEVCCTLGLLSVDQAKQLEDAGLHAYNHNLDTSEGFYGSVITTRRYADRLATLANVRETDVTLCSGGILGLGEKVRDRLEMLRTLAALDPHPESVPVNVLSKVDGTPMADQPDVPWHEVVRVVAVARIALPASVVRLSAGRSRMGEAEQALCFMAGANSIFSSEHGHMLTAAVASPTFDADAELFRTLGLRPMPSTRHPHAPVELKPEPAATTACCASS